MNKIKKSVAILIAFILCTSSMYICPVFAQDKAVLDITFVKASSNIKVGDTFEIYFKVADAPRLFTFGLNGNFDSKYIRVGDEDTKSNVFSPYVETGLEAKNLVDNAAGAFQFIYCISNSKLTDGKLAKITFKAIKKGKTTITLNKDTVLLRKVTDPEVNIPYKSNSLTVNITDNTQPKKPTKLFNDNFESKSFATKSWTNSKCEIYKSTSYTARFNNNDSLAKSIKTSSYKNISVKYSRIITGFDKGDSFVVEWYNGHKWYAMEKVTKNSKLVTKTWKLSSSAGNNSKFRIRFRAVKLGSKDYVKIDNVEVWGTKI